VSRAETYFERSRTYAAAAEAATDLRHKIKFLQMAQHWAHLGKVAEQYATAAIIEDHPASRGERA
jgi:hypothetical protein